MRRALIAASLALLLAPGCRGIGGEVRDTRSDSVDQRLLSPSGGAAGAGKIERYAPGPQEAFRMPLLHDNVDPALPADTPRATLPPTTVCMRVIIDREGAVERVEPLLDRAECAAGGDAANADLLAAVAGAVKTWRYQPAAICHYPAPAPRDPHDCADAERVEPVPVTLSYAFTFQMERGQVRVQRGGVGGR